jgi:hypothetical protein
MVELIAGLALLAGPPFVADEARGRVERAMNLLGGRAKLESIRQLTVTTMGHDYLVEQSERPSGPYVTVYRRGTRTYDFDKLSETSEITFAGLVYGARELKRPITIERGAGRAMPMELFQSYRRLALGPERALIVAAAAKDLSSGREVMFNGVPHEVVSFTWGRVPVRLFLKKDTGAPSGVETTNVLPFPWSVWGDVPVTTRWTNWQVLEGGVMEPSQFTTEINGYPVADETVLSSKVTLGPGSAVVAPPLPIAREDVQAILARYKPVKVADGITEYEGPFNTFVVEQPDGLVVVEPVMSPAFATSFLDKLAKEYPGKRVKAVVATDDAWPHFGGIRSFIARGAELIVLDLNRPLVQRFYESIHRTAPDELTLRPAKVRYNIVRKPKTIGSGPNRMILYPVGGQGSERMMMAYFPAHRLLYGSDLLQKQAEGFFFPAYPKELYEAVQRERLEVDTVFGEHLLPTPWSVVAEFVRRTMGPPRT